MANSALLLKLEKRVQTKAPSQKRPNTKRLANFELISSLINYNLRCSNCGIFELFGILENPIIHARSI